MKNWYLLQTKPNQENKAILNLENQSFIVYQPKITTRKKLKGQWQTKIEALFPRYLFIQLGNEDDWTKIRSTLGVSRFVRFGASSKPSRVQDEVIEDIKEQEKILNQETIVGEQFKKGEKILLKNDNFNNIEAIFQEKSKEDRVFILLNLLGKEHKIEVNENNINKS